MAAVFEKLGILIVLAVLLAVGMMFFRGVQSQDADLGISVNVPELSLFEGKAEVNPVEKARGAAIEFADTVVANGCIYSKPGVRDKRPGQFDRIWRTLCDTSSPAMIDRALWVCVFEGPDGFSPVILMRVDLDEFSAGKLYLARGWEEPECAYVQSAYISDPARFLTRNDRSNCGRLYGIDLPIKWLCTMMSD